MERHLRIISLLFIIYGFMMFVSGLFNIISYGFIKEQLDFLNQNNLSVSIMHFNITQLINILYIIDTQLSLFIGLPAFLGGFALFNQKSWARPLLISVGILILFNLPIGTIIGLYSLWFLCKPETALVFQSQTA